MSTINATLLPTGMHSFMSSHVWQLRRPINNYSSLGLVVLDQRTLASSKKLSVEQPTRLLFCRHSRAECTGETSDMNVGIFGRWRFALVLTRH